jgi:uncharacterized protein YjbJ (UPF0337 family)
MNWDKVHGNWLMLKEKIKEKWHQLTDDELHMIAGRRDLLLEKLQEKYGLARQEAERQIQEVMDKAEEQFEEIQLEKFEEKF